MALIEAVLQKNYISLLKILLEESPNSTKEVVTPLYCAITGTTTKTDLPTKKGDTKIVKLLLKNKADPNKKFLLMTPIYTATFENNYEMLILLIKYGGNVNNHSSLKVVTVDSNRKFMLCRTPLVLAVQNCYYDCVRILLKYGAIYNEFFIKYTKKLVDQAKEKKYTKEDNLNKYEDYKKIYKLLKTHYNAILETKTNEYTAKHYKFNDILNYFEGFEE